MLHSAGNFISPTMNVGEKEVTAVNAKQKHRKKHPFSSLFLFLFHAFIVNLEKFKSQLGQHCENVKK